jgi:hypothetical protein
VPFFINGDTAWSLIVNLTQADASTYLADRRAKGYNAILVNLIDRAFADNAPNNIYNDAPFSTPGNFATPNEAYFAHADWVMDEAEANGLLVLLAPIYLGYNCGSEGWCSYVQAASEATMEGWGRYVGNRYQSYDNILWVIGGDTNPSAYSLTTKMEKVITGIKQYDPHKLMTAHVNPEYSPMDEWGSPSWLNLNNSYTYNSTATDALAEYNRSGAKPLFLMESDYENEHSSTALSLRRQAYWSVLSGATVGHLFGNCPIWHFDAPGTSSFCTGVGGWYDNLSSTPSTTLAYVGRLFQSRNFWLLVPDQTDTVMTAGKESGDTLATTARASDGSTVIAYIPDSRQVTMDMSEVSGASAKCWWWNPRTAAATLIDTYANSGTRNFTPPDNNDWVLVMDNSSLGLSAPGTLLSPTNLRWRPR